MTSHGSGQGGPPPGWNPPQPPYQEAGQFQAPVRYGQQPPRRPRAGWWIAAIVVVVIAVAAALIAVIVGRSDDGSAADPGAATASATALPADSVTVEVTGPAGAEVFISLVADDGSQQQSWSLPLPATKTVQPAASGYYLTVISTDPGGDAIETVVRHGELEIARFVGGINMQQVTVG